MLGFSKAEIRPRRFLRIAFDEKILLSIIDDGDQSRGNITQEPLEVHALNFSGPGIAIRCSQQSRLALGMHCLLKIRHPQFPGYDPTQGTATLKGKVGIHLLFHTDLTFQDDLGNGNHISEDLRQEFDDNEIALSENVSVSVRKEDTAWLITDGDEKQQIYVVRAAGKLDIYDVKRRADFLGESNTDLIDF